MMANKTVVNIPVKLLIMIWVVVVIGCSNNMLVTEAVSDCAEPCMPVCLKEEGATLHVCEIACENYCQQISGSGGIA
ncbi:hypothetical protein RchiOBHm_Chr1g0362981 [Rosa chinensis]|uniref:Thionin-like protein n=1 Tax=Rosa chinensis TaxID=74649 RepID=A0A2P6SJC6_ROSCH|nr:hypothetical protein RchiOBHm_Chr1g0362981 [Rosa chinensis]